MSLSQFTKRVQSGAYGINMATGSGHHKNGSKHCEFCKASHALMSAFHSVFAGQDVRIGSPYGHWTKYAQLFGSAT